MSKRPRPKGKSSGKKQVRRTTPVVGTESRPSRRLWLSLAGLSVFSIGVFLGALAERGPRRRWPEPAPRPSSSRLGTKRMVALLERIARGADPKVDLYHLNARRAALYLRELQELAPEPADAAETLYLAANELLLSGRTEDAVKVLRELERALEDLPAGSEAKLKDRVDELFGLSYLRLGEQRNCIERHNAASCLLPIREDGIHRDERGSRDAIHRFETLLERRPDHVTARWLLNLAYMTLGEFPDAVPAKWRVPEELFAGGDELEPFVDRAPELGLDVDGLAGGVVAEDFDRDGDLDILCSSWGLRDQIRLFRNEGDGSFTDHTDEAGLTGIVSGLNLVHADYDNDGYPDVLVLRGAWLGEAGLHPNSLLRNRGDLSFEDVTYEAGLLSLRPTQTAAWADYDNDGWLDLYIGNESRDGPRYPAELFHNNGDGSFTELASDCGVDVTGIVKAVVWGDVDNDGRPDLYVSRLTEANLLFRNDGPGNDGGWKFTEVSERAGVTMPTYSFPAWFFDYNNDGWLDLFVSGYSAARGDFGVDYMALEHQNELPRLYENQGDGSFADVSAAAGLERPALSMGSSFGDLDNDGFLDFYLGTGEPDFRALVPNRMYRNEGGRRFQDVTTSGGFGHVQKGHGVVFADFDRDGDQDIYEVMGGAYSGDRYRNVLFENPGSSGHFLALDLEGTESNRSAIGARIQVRVETPDGTRDIYATVGTGGSFGSTTLRRFIGLGDAVSVRFVEIHWPTSRQTQRFDDIPLDRLVSAREDDAEPKISKLESIPFKRYEKP